MDDSQKAINEGVIAARLFMKNLKQGNSEARARWNQILQDARRGDPGAQRAVRLMRWAMTHPVFVIGARPVLSHQRILELKQLLIQARNAPPG